TITELKKSETEAKLGVGFEVGELRGGVGCRGMKVVALVRI
ncbi:MAG: hypothetical protein RL226_1448, partial [Bacteroidota bacterium]